MEEVNGVRTIKGVHGVKIAIGSQKSRKSNGKKESSDKLWGHPLFPSKKNVFFLFLKFYIKVDQGPL